MIDEIVVPEGMRRAVGNVPVFSGVSGEQTTEIIDGILNSVLRYGQRSDVARWTHSNSFC